MTNGALQFKIRNFLNRTTPLYHPLVLRCCHFMDTAAIKLEDNKKISWNHDRTCSMLTIIQRPSAAETDKGYWEGGETVNGELVSTS